MKKIFFLVLITVLFGINCGPRYIEHYHIYSHSHSIIPLKEISIHVDRDFGAADKVAIQNAVDQWNFAMNGFIKLNIINWNFMMEPNLLKDKTAWFILKAHSSKPGRPADNPGSYILAYCDRLGGNYVYMLRDRIFNEDMKGVTMHELGHLFGVDHIGVHLMHAQYQRGSYHCIDYETIHAAAVAQNLDVGLLNYCIYEKN